MIEQNQSTAPPLEADDRLKSFASCCKEAGILNKPEELEEQDLGDGLIDSPTLWFVENPAIGTLYLTDAGAF